MKRSCTVSTLSLYSSEQLHMHTLVRGSFPWGQHHIALGLILGAQTGRVALTCRFSIWRAPIAATSIAASAFRVCSVQARMDSVKIVGLYEAPPFNHPSRHSVRPGVLGHLRHIIAQVASSRSSALPSRRFVQKQPHGESEPHPTSEGMAKESFVDFSQPASVDLL